MKISKETEISKKIELKEAEKVCYRYRLTFFCDDFPFEIDLSMRVFPKNKNMKIPEFSDSDVSNPIYNSSPDYSIIYDLEFEMLKDYQGTNEEALNKLKDLLRRTAEEYEGKIEDSRIDKNLMYRSTLSKSTSSTSKSISSNSSKSPNKSQLQFQKPLQIINGRDLKPSKIKHLSNIELIYSDYSEKLDGGDSEISNKMKTLIEMTFDFRYTPQVDVLTNRIIDDVDLSNFVYLEKTDGLRTLLISDGNNLYQYRNKEGLKKMNSADCIRQIENSIFVIDSENVSDKYYVFDVYYVNEDVRELGFIERMNKFKDFKFSNIILKDYKQVEIKKLKELIEYGMTRRPGVDGIVLQSKEGYAKNEWLKKSYQYKLKPLS